MRVAVISDLHLGQRDAADDFGHEDGAFLRFLLFLERNFERIVLLGDVYETLTSRTPGQAARALGAAREAHPLLARRFERPQYAYVHGNHDEVAGSLLRAPEQLVLEADGVRVLFTHGHRHDWVIRRAKWLSHAAVWAGGWLRRAGLRHAYRAFDRLDYALRRGVGDPVRCTFQAWALQRACAASADIVVTGHTHVGMRAEHGARLFLNSGSCSRGHFSFLGLDTARGDYALHRAW